jgi:hypothetical protein
LALKTVYAGVEGPATGIFGSGESQECTKSDKPKLS